MESLLVDKTELTQMYDISKNYRDDRLDTYIWRAQRNDLKPFLSPELYYDLMENITDAKYVTLLDGGDYTYQGKSIYFQGVKDLVSAWTYARILDNTNLMVTAKGVKTKTDPNSTPTEGNIYEIKAMEARNEAMYIQGEVDQFLSNNNNDYPLYSPTSDALKRTGFVFIPVLPRSRRR